MIIVHLGLGRFHRAHQAEYFQNLKNIKEFNGFICGVSLRSKGHIESLKEQNFKYHILVEDKASEKLEDIDIIREAYYVPEDYGKIYERISEASLVTLTVTEKGYCYEPSSKSLNLELKEVKSDLKGIDSPETLFGILYNGLVKRFESNALSPLTILSCDNLPGNGRLIKTVLLQFIEKRNNPQLADWVKNHVSFPNSMVDRIVPSIEKEEIEELESKFKINDKLLVKTEKFKQWVIENSFNSDFSALSRVGVEFVDRVEPYEDMKLRLLNGSHSAMAYCGQLLGLKFVHEGIEDKNLKALVERLWVESRETLSELDNFDISKYCSQLIERYKNPHLMHKLEQIAMDGSQKVNQRWLIPIKLRKEKGQRSVALSFCLASWIYYLEEGLKKEKYIISDPVSQIFLKKLEEGNHPVEAILGIKEIFESWCQEKEFLNQIKTYFDAIKQNSFESALISIL